MYTSISIYLFYIFSLSDYFSPRFGNFSLQRWRGDVKYEEGLTPLSPPPHFLSDAGQALPTLQNSLAPPDTFFPTTSPPGSSLGAPPPLLGYTPPLGVLGDMEAKGTDLQ